MTTAFDGPLVPEENENESVFSYGLSHFNGRKFSSSPVSAMKSSTKRIPSRLSISVQLVAAFFISAKALTTFSQKIDRTIFDELK